MKKIEVMLAGAVVAMAAQLFAAVPTITAVTAQQRYPWNGLVDIVVTISGEESDVAKATCTFAVTNSATQTALAISHVTQVGTDSGSGSSWTRRFLWDTNADVGEVKIADVELEVEVAGGDDGLGGVQLWKGGPYWAECNVGASKPEEYGSYFMWGDTVGHKPSISFTREWNTTNNCPTWNKSIAKLRSLGYIDSSGNLTAAHDAATAHLDIPWRMPTRTEFSELRLNCDRVWTTRNGVNGLLVTGRSAYASKSIFLPAAGECFFWYRLDYAGSDGHYWSSTPDSKFDSCFADLLFFRSDCFFECGMKRHRGMPVRPLRGVSASGNVTSAASTHFALDNRTGVRVANVAEEIRFSPAWEPEAASAIARVSTTGVVVASGSEEGTFEWTPTQDGTYQFTHAVLVNGVQVGETLTATFVVGELPLPEFEFEIDDQTGCASVTAYIGSGKSVDIPEFAYFDSFGVQTTALVSDGKSYHVTGIADCAFSGNETIQYLSFPASIEQIEDYAFYGCQNLLDVTIPESVTFIGKGAFACCPKLKSATVLGNVELPVRCFAQDTDLQQVIVGDAVTSLLEDSDLSSSDFPHSSPFLGCGNLQVVQIGKGITEIPPYVFANLAALKKVVIKGSITGTIGGYAFAGCTALEELNCSSPMEPTSILVRAFYHVPSSLDIDFTKCTFIGSEAFTGCAGFSGSCQQAGVLLLPLVQTIGDGAFEGCSRIIGVSFGAEVEEILANAFKNSGVREVRFEGAPPAVVEDGAFADLDETPEGVVVNVDDYQAWRDVIDSDSGMWHGVYFPYFATTVHGRVFYSLFAIDGSADGFDPKNVTAILAKKVKDAKGNDVLMEIDRFGYSSVEKAILVDLNVDGECQVYFEYADGTWKSVLRYDEFTSPFLDNRFKTVYFRKTDEDWTLTVRLYDANHKKMPYATCVYGSEPSYEIGHPDILVPVSTLLETDIAKPTSWCGDYTVQWYRYKDGKVGGKIQDSAINVDYSDDHTLDLFCEWEWFLFEEELEKAEWNISSMKFEQKYTFVNGFAVDNETKELTQTTEVVSGGKLSFVWKTSCEDSYNDEVLRDHAEFLVDGEVVATSDGESMWKEVSVNLSGGKSHTVTWRYVKDGSGSAGEDCVWVSDIQFSSIADEETTDELLDESEYNWFYEDVESEVAEDNPFEYNPNVTPENSKCQIDVCVDLGEVNRATLNDNNPDGVQAGIVRVSGAVGLEYAVLTANGWTTVGNESVHVAEEEETKVSFIVDYSKVPSTVKYMISGHTLTNAEGVASFVSAVQTANVQAIEAKGKGAVNTWAGKYKVANSDVQEVATNTETVLVANLDTYSNETFHVTGGGTLVIPSDKVPAGGINRKLHIDGNSAVKFDLTGLTTIPTVMKLFNGVGNSFAVGSNMKLVVPGEGVERVSKLFVKDGNLEARVAERPTMDDSSSGESPFNVSSDGDTSTAATSIGNAVEGFWYGLETTESLNADFSLDHDSVKQCTSTGPMKLESSANANSDSGFYRVSVSAEEP